MQNRFISIGSICGLLAVALGAFGAHALKTRLEAEQLAIFETAVKYQFYHALAMLFTALLVQKFPSSKLNLAGYLFLAGIILFSGSLYLMVASYVHAETPMKWLGAITPFGGLCFIGGWLALFIFSIQNKSTAI